LKLQILNEFNVLKQGDTKSEIRLKLLDFSESPLDLTGKTVNVVIANSIGKVLEKTPAIDSTDTGVIYFQFSPDDVTGYGDMRLEVHVTDSSGEVQIIPSNGYYKFQLDRSLDELAGGDVTSYTLQYFLDEVTQKKKELESVANEAIDKSNEANVKADEAVTTANTAESKADSVQTQFNQVVIEGDSSVEAAQARVTEDGTSFDTLRDRLNAGDEQLAQMEEQLKESKRHTKTLQHGLNIIEASQPSPVNVEFYGVTRANRFGEKGKVSKTSLVGSYEYDIPVTVNLKAGDNILFILHGKVNVDTIKIKDSANTIVLQSTNVNYLKYNATNDGEYSFWYSPATDGDVSFDSAVYIISQATYDKIGDLSLIGKDQEFVEKAFPYVSGVQSVVNPVIRVAGANLLPPFYEWELDENANIISPYKLELNATGNFQESYYDLEVLPNQEYYYQIEGMSENGRIIARCLDNDKNALTTIFAEGTLTTTSNTSYIRIEVDNGGYGAGTFTFSQPMLTLGSEPRPFVPKNDSYLYAYKVNEETGENEPLILAGNDDKKDNLFDVNYEIGKAKKRKWWEADVTLNGSTISSATKELDYDGYSLVSLILSEMSTPVINSAIVEKYDGSILTPYVDAYDKADISYNNATSFKVTISDEDATGYDLTTTAGIQAYFTDNPYKLTYQLSKPIVEEVRVEGDLSIQGSAQVEVGEGVIVREKVIPVLSSDGTIYGLNVIGGSGLYYPQSSKLNYRLNQFIEIFKNGKIDTHNWVVEKVDGVSYGNSDAFIDESLFDPNATYTVTYEILDKHDFTTNLNEVVAYYNSSIKSSIQGVVSKQTRIATDVSILFGTTAALLRIIKGLEGA
jgi:hypothetical protein